MAKKRFTFADAKEEIKNLKKQLQEANVKLDDNVVTQGELKWLKFYKIVTIFSMVYFTGKLLFWLT